ncbi:hypothetical protein ACTACB_23145 [Pseudomonas syringae]|uniref:hypothetical protein n=1 Tax=Pseudomonas syringae TaxID=317 RepID=UPI003F763394
MAPILPEQVICGEKSMGWQQPSGQRDHAFPPSTGQLRQIESKQFEPFLGALA